VDGITRALLEDVFARPADQGAAQLNTGIRHRLKKKQSASHARQTSKPATSQICVCYLRALVNIWSIMRVSTSGGSMIAFR
jgi:hypothetical protein